MLKKLGILVFFCCLLQGAFAQQDKVVNALKYLQEGRLDTAKLLIDEAKEHEETSTNPTTWYYRGYIYKEIYNKRQKDNKKSPARLEAIESFDKFLALDTAGELTENVSKSLKYLGSTLYNDAATSLNTTDYEIAVDNYKQYKETMRIIEPDKNFESQDIQFKLVLGNVYTQIYEQDKEANKEFFNKIKNTYNDILAIDSVNVSANYNLGILYYNEAVNIIKSLDYETDLITLELIQDECVELFKKSLPYMKKAYELDPKRKETLIGLSGIYFSLNEMEKSEKIQKELKQLQEDDDPMPNK